MISVVCSEAAKPYAEEFFELFKTPWTLREDGAGGSVLLVCGAAAVPEGPDLAIVFGVQETAFDRSRGIQVKPHPRSGAPFKSREHPHLFYGRASVSPPPGSRAVVLAATDHICAARFPDRTVIRVGWDLFEEIRYLLVEGQPSKYAHRPTLDEHIQLLRSWIVAAGVPLIEIPPRPRGHAFTVCLSHDVDFLGIRHHLFDRTIVGFLTRALLPFFFGHMGGRPSFREYLRNISAVLQLPLFATGLKKDIWDKLARYSELEKGLASTFFMIPYRDEPGEKIPAGMTYPSLPGWRAARYDVRDYSKQLRDLRNEGHEIGLHGLDAWCDAEKGRRESSVIRSIVGEGKVGTRMHWLYRDHDTPAVLEKAGFDYDSSVGYNDSIGFRSGTAQVHRMSADSRVLELPLIVQDTAMFYRKRMALSKKEGAARCIALVDEIQDRGGVFTVNWHQRSLAPERNWEGFYLDLLAILKSRGPWFATCADGVEWFRMRRRIRFEHLDRVDGQTDIRVRHTGKEGLPKPFLRRYRPGADLASGIKGDLPLLFDDLLLEGAGESKAQAALKRENP